MLFVCSVWQCTFFDRYKLLSAATYYFRQLYTTFGGYILLSTAIYYFQRYILLLPDWDFIRIQDFPAIPYICGLKARLEFNITLLTLIWFRFFL